MTNSCMIAPRRKMLRRNTRVTFWNNEGSKFAKSAISASTRLSWLHLMQNCLGTGGSKDRVSLNNLFAKRQADEIFALHRHLNTRQSTQRSKSLSLQLQHGARTAILACGSIRVTPGIIRTCTSQLRG